MTNGKENMNSDGNKTYKGRLQKWETFKQPILGLTSMNVIKRNCKNIEKRWIKYFTVNLKRWEQKKIYFLKVWQLKQNR